MSNFPDFSQDGYQVIRELGRNREAGRITYLATALNSNQQVVIKEFRFAVADASWSSFKAYEREIEVLQQLDHLRIPTYLDSLETPQGFCLVQEYKNALSLAVKRSFTCEQIKQIAVSVLEILVYLQKRIPPVIHRDIKPENILVDKELNAYLVDFGLARIQSKSIALSSLAAGTPGFMPPEEQFGRPLTAASDIYSLGATIICLVTGTRSLDIGNLIADLSYTNLEYSSLISADLRGANLVGANLRGTKMPDANLAEADLRGANLEKTYLAGAWDWLSPADGDKECLLGANLTKANLENTNLQGAILGATEETIVDLSCDGGANLTDANLSRANLRDAKLAGAILSRTNLRGAIMPDGMKWP